MIKMYGYPEDKNDEKITNKIEIEYRATLDALKKAEAWRKKYPIKVDTELMKIFLNKSAGKILK